MILAVWPSLEASGRELPQERKAIMTLAIQELVPAIQFFQEWAGWCTPPGKMACARSLAQAEADADLLGFTFEWVIDEDGCIGCDCGDKRCKCSSGAEHETLACVCRDNKGAVLASLCGICEPSREYKRVVQAELAVEALAS